MDIVALMIVGFGTAAGWKRGLVLEITDWGIGLVAGFIAFRGFRPLGSFLHRLIKGWSQDSCESLGFWFLLLFFGVMVLSLGLHVDRATREFDRIPKTVRDYGGAIFAFFKCLMLAALLCAYLPYSDGLAAAEKKALRDSTASNVLKGLRAPIGVFVRIIAPEDIAKKYDDAVNR